jgi:hypothetical protein
MWTTVSIVKAGARRAHFNESRQHQAQQSFDAPLSSGSLLFLNWTLSVRRLLRLLVAARVFRLAPILIMSLPPDAHLVAAFGCAVKPRVHSPKAVQSARIGGISVINNAVLKRERAHARPLAYVRVHVGPAHGSELTGSVGCRARRYRGDRSSCS